LYPQDTAESTNRNTAKIGRYVKELLKPAANLFTLRGRFRTRAVGWQRPEHICRQPQCHKKRPAIAGRFL